MPDTVATQLAEIFSTEIDFHRELRKGDTFSVVYEALTADGEPVPWNQGAGRVLAAEFVNAGHAHSAVWFADASGKGAYFDLSGRSKHSAFLASPLAFSRITSGFSMRFHPILKEWKRHEGVDYGAPTGTPVHVVGEPASGTLVQIELNTLSIEVEATKIPNAIELNVEDAESGTQYLAGEIALPEGATLLTDAEAIAVLIAEPSRPTAEDEAADEEAAAEGETAAPADEA